MIKVSPLSRCWSCGTAGLAEAERQPRQTAQPEIRTPDERPGLKCPIGQPSQHQLKGNLTFDARQGRTEAEVRRPPERKMPVVGAGNVQAVRISKPLRISIPCGHYRNYSLPLSNPPCS